VQRPSVQQAFAYARPDLAVEWRSHRAPAAALNPKSSAREKTNQLLAKQREPPSPFKPQRCFASFDANLNDRQWVFLPIRLRLKIKTAFAPFASLTERPTVCFCEFKEVKTRSFRLTSTAVS
jgi:hypothetical protein